MYHHTVMPMISWGATKYYPGGHGTFIGNEKTVGKLINCVIMTPILNFKTANTAKL